MKTNHLIFKYRNLYYVKMNSLIGWSKVTRMNNKSYFYSLITNSFEIEPRLFLDFHNKIIKEINIESI